MEYDMYPRGSDYWEHMEDDVLFNRWWDKVSNGNDIPTTKKIAYAAWQEGIRAFISQQNPIAYWETSSKASDHVTFDSKLSNKWKTHYNMQVESLYTLPKTEVQKKVSKDCSDD